MEASVSNEDYEEQLDYGEEDERQAQAEDAGMDDQAADGQQAPEDPDIINHEDTGERDVGTGNTGDEMVEDHQDRATEQTELIEASVDVREQMDEAAGTTDERQQPDASASAATNSDLQRNAQIKAEAATPAKEPRAGRIISLQKVKADISEKLPLKSLAATASASSTRALSSCGGDAVASGSGPTRFFIIRSSTDANIRISQRENAWATQRHNERVLSNALSGGNVKLLFAVNRVGFYGYASMTTVPGQLGRTIYWDGGQVFGGAFAVDWECTCELPFGAVSHIRNPMNENKPVGVCRDGTEVPNSVADELIRLMDEHGKPTDRTARAAPRPNSTVQPPPPVRRAAPLVPPVPGPMRGVPPQQAGNDRRGAPMMPRHAGGGRHEAVPRRVEPNGMAGRRNGLFMDDPMQIGMMDPHIAAMLAMGSMGLPNMPPMGMQMDHSMFLGMQHAMAGMSGMRSGMNPLAAMNPMAAMNPLLGGMGMVRPPTLLPPGIGLNNGMLRQPPPPPGPAPSHTPLSMNGGLGRGGGLSTGSRDTGLQRLLDSRDRAGRQSSRSCERRNDSRAVRSRSRSRSRDRAPERAPDMMSMSYDEYLDYYRKAQQKLSDVTRERERSPRRGGSDRGRSPRRGNDRDRDRNDNGNDRDRDVRQGRLRAVEPARGATRASACNGFHTSSVGGGVGGGGGGGGGGGYGSGSDNLAASHGVSGSGAKSGGQPYSEEEYVKVTKAYYVSRGAIAPPEEYIRNHYRQMKQQYIVSGGGNSNALR